MKLAVSNIAWTNEEEKDIAELLQEMGVKYVEVAPTKIWDDPTKVSDKEILEYKTFWNSFGIEIVAFQAMLFPRPELKIFGSTENKNELITYLENFIPIAPKMGAGVMVFGSPKNRQKGKLSESAALDIAIPFFDSLGETARNNQVYMCIEPNPVAYACDFITNTKQGIDLVNKVGNSGFGLHLDIAGMTLAGDDITSSIRDSKSVLKHFHISAPYLEQVEANNNVDYQTAAESLRSIGYDRYVSIEMKPAESGTNVERVKKAVLYSQQVFGDS